MMLYPWLSIQWNGVKETMTMEKHSCTKVIFVLAKQKRKNKSKSRARTMRKRRFRPRITSTLTATKKRKRKKNRKYYYRICSAGVHLNADILRVLENINRNTHDSMSGQIFEYRSGTYYLQFPYLLNAFAISFTSIIATTISHCHRISYHFQNAIHFG